MKYQGQLLPSNTVGFGISPQRAEEIQNAVADHDVDCTGPGGFDMRRFFDELPIDLQNPLELLYAGTLMGSGMLLQSMRGMSGSEILELL